MLEVRKDSTGILPIARRVLKEKQARSQVGELNTQPLDCEARLSIWMSGILGLRRKAGRRRWRTTNRAQDRARYFTHIKGTSA